MHHRHSRAATVAWPRLNPLPTGLGPLPPPHPAQRTPVQRQVAAELARAAEQGSGRRYVAAATGAAAGPGGPDAVLLLHQAATPADILQGYCAALMLAWGSQLGRGGGQPRLWPAAAQQALADPDAWFSSGSSSSGADGVPAGSHQRSKDGSSVGYAGFLDALDAAGWDLGRVALMQGQARLEWGGADLHSE